MIDKTRPTTKKRFVSENQQILRVDSESNQIIKKDVENKIINLFNKKLIILVLLLSLTMTKECSQKI